jgi:regulatory protein
MALDALQAKGFINEQRVLESVLHRRSAKLGTARIRQELQGKGLAAEAVLEAVEQLRTTEVERAREVWRRKFGEPPTNAADRGKQMRFLASRGFGGDAIRRVVAGDDD